MPKRVRKLATDDASDAFQLNESSAIIDQFDNESGPEDSHDEDVEDRLDHDSAPFVFENDDDDDALETGDLNGFDDNDDSNVSTLEYDSDQISGLDDVTDEEIGSGDDLDPAELQEKYLAKPDSEDEDFVDGPVNTIGNVPLEWYEDFPHIGYDLNGKRIMRPATKDELDALLAKMDDPDDWKKFRDEVLHEDRKLTPEEIDILRKLHRNEFPDASIDPFEPSVDWFTQDVMIEPLTATPEPKRRFIPSKHEHKRIMNIVRAIRKGIIIPNRPKEPEAPRFYDIWKDEIEVKRIRDHIAAPKMKLPDHSESYHPAPEYLPTEEEKQAWLAQDPEDRHRSYLPQSYPNMRSVPAYDRFIQERFSRCLDLYLCPRALKKPQILPEDLIPKLPDPKDLEPFPKQICFQFRGHTDRVRTCAMDPTGQWMATGSDDKTVRVWEVMSGRCMRTYIMSDIVLNVSWNPSKDVSLLSVSCEKKVILMNPLVACRKLSDATDLVLEKVAEKIKSNTTEQPVTWSEPSDDEFKLGYRLILTHAHEIGYMTWHRKGDYFAVLCPDAGNKSVLIHQLSKQASQAPFKNTRGIVQRILFHPSKPFFFVATQRHVRVYNLIAQQLHKVLNPGARWISSMAIHPGGDNLIVGTYDKKVCWFDMDLSVRPYKVLRYHTVAVRNVTFHPRYPMFSTCGDDGNVHVFHGMVYHDLMKNPLIVPVKILKAHQQVGALGTLTCEFHPTQPWVVSCGANGEVKLFS